MSFNNLLTVYRAADDRILTLLAKAVQQTLDAPDPRSASLLIEHRLTRDLKRIVAELNAAVPGMVDTLLDDAAAEGERQA